MSLECLDFVVRIDGNLANQKDKLTTHKIIYEKPS